MITLNQAGIDELCQRRHVRKLSLFGSVLRDDFGSDSDVDILVEFEPDAVVGYLEMAEMELEMAELLGHRADVRTAAELSPYFRQDVLDNAEVVYVRR